MFKKFAQIFRDFAKVFTDFAQISPDFAQIFRDFARIFIKSKLLGVRLHPLQPRLLHHWRIASNVALTARRTTVSIC